MANHIYNLQQESNRRCYYLNNAGNKIYVKRKACKCHKNKEIYGNLRSEVLVDKGIYVVSYNELYEQPNWLTYTVSEQLKTADRKGMYFYKETGIHTSDDEDYVQNPWDKGHLAPAAAFSDTYDHLKTTFSYLNCSMQWDALNRGQWAELEAQERKWSVQYGDIKVKIELIFEADHLIRSTGVHVPTGFWKHLTFPDQSKKCYYFPNEDVPYQWDHYLKTCNE